MQFWPLLQWWQLLLASLLVVVGNAQVTVTLQSTASEIVYTPPACNSAAESCESAWQVLPAPDAPGDYVTSTSGPTVGSGDLIPQMFLTFRGTSLYIHTSPLSTALANVTLSTQRPTVSITTQVNTTANLISVIGLPGSLDTTLAITYIASDEPTRLDIANLTIITPNNDTSPFSPTTLSPTASIPAFLPTVSVAPLLHESAEQRNSDIAAEVLGAVLGAVFGGLGLVAVAYCWKRRRRLADPDA